MRSMTQPRLAFLVLLLLIGLSAPTVARLSPQEAPQVSPSLFAEMKWRNIGPFRAGRTKAAAGHRSQPFTFYIGMVNGGVWKTTDAGRTWKPIFEDQPTGSIGAIAVAPSDANVVYVGTGEGLPRPDLAVGDGIYKSTDAGKTWTHLGLRDAQQIPKIAVDPNDANRLFVAALGHPYGPNKERGIFRSLDGGRTFQQVLFKDENTGGKDVDIDPANPNIVYATMWEQRQGPWENGAWNGTNGGLFKSTDGGTTWTQMKQGLPDGVDQRGAGDRAVESAPSVRDARSRRRRHGRLSIRRCRRDVGARDHRQPADVPHQRSRAARASEGRRHRHRHGHRVSSSQRTARRRSCRSRARRAATTTRTSGGIRTTPTSCCSSSTRAPS